MYIFDYSMQKQDSNKEIIPESPEYKRLIENYKKQGKLIDRIVRKKNDNEFDVTWIWDSKESFEAFKKEPIQLLRQFQMNKVVQRNNITEEEI